ncbi:MAG: CoA transferase [Myxococcota bacterium]
MDRERLETLLAAARLPLPAPDAVAIAGHDPILPSRFPIGEAAAAAIGLGAAGAATLWELRGGAPQTARVEVRAAAAHLLGFLLQSVPGLDLTRFRNAATELYPTGDGRHVFLHGGFPALAEGLLALLECPMDADAIRARLAGWKAADLEDAIAERGLCGAMVRTAAEWSEHPQSRALAELPAVEILPLGDAPAEPLPEGDRPLAGVRVLDLTRVLAGPSCGRALAEHGADVLRVGAPGLPSIEPFVVETGRGKRNAFLDLDVADQRERLRGLAREADVFCQGYRSGSLDRRGFSPADLAALRPGIVYVSINCYGHEGPWAGRPGWEQLAQSASGMAAAEGGDAPPRLVPAAATDYTTGALAAWGVMEALRRRATEGGSWWVRASLCQTAMWLTRLGADLDPAQARGLGDVASLQQRATTAWGELTHLAPAATLECTPLRYALPPSPLGSHPAEWRPRGA